MTEFKIGAALKATPPLIVFLAMLLGPPLWAGAAVIRDLRVGDNKEYVRMVLEFDRPLIPPPSFSIHGDTLQISLAGIINNLPDLQTGEYDGDIVHLDVSKTVDAMRIDAVYSFTPADVKAFALTGPHRFIIDAYRHPAPAAAGPPLEKSRHLGLIEETVSLPGPHSEPEKPLPAEASSFLNKTSTQTDGSPSSPIGSTDHLSRKRFQQRLVAALIAVTAIIVVLLLLLIWTGRSRTKPAAPSWVHDLPPTKDRDIESIDSVIGKHLKIHDQP
jgi:hypothetical protein